MSIGSVDIYLTDPLQVSLNDGDGEPFAVIELSPHPARVYIAVRTRAEADDLIKAALAARDLLPEPEIDPATLNDALHGENHIDNAGHATAAHFPACEPGTCITCGAHVDAAGNVTPAVAR